ncbi:hypothetical protein BSKO_08457 [Bryopsis sp. KO-2023]|nr:hypothetical protein BSKO_08457 [Bryopsis sp. KO-2023]
MYDIRHWHPLMVDVKALGVALRKAARGGELEKVKELIEEGADVKSADKRYEWTALHHAANGDTRGHFNIAKELITAGAEVNAQNVDGQTPLHLAARRGYGLMVDLLLESKAELDIKDQDGRTALAVASENHPDIARKMMGSAGAVPGGGKIFGRRNPDPNAEGIGEEKRRQEEAEKVEEELREAAADGDLEGVKEVLELYPEIDINAADLVGQNALYKAVFNGRTETVKFLVAKGADPDHVDTKLGQGALHVAAKKGFNRIVQELLLPDLPTNVDAKDYKGRTPLLIACGSGNADVVQVLLEFDADMALVDDDGQSPLYIASEEGHADVVRSLLKASGRGHRNIDIDAPTRGGETALHAAASRGNVAISRMLINNGGDMEVRDLSGSTPLFLAAVGGQTRMTKVLLEEFEADVDASNLVGETALYVASLKGHVAIVKELLKNNADPEASLTNGATPLMAAAQEGQTAVMSQLIAHDANIHAANQVGETALLIASLEGYGNAVALLVHNGADILAAENRGRTALHLAARDGHVGVIKVLLAASSKEAQTESGWKVSPAHLAADTRGETALHFAARFGHVSAMEQLLAYDENLRGKTSPGSASGAIYGMLIDLPNKFGWTALHAGVDGQHYGSVALLLSHGASINAPDKFGNTPLHLAARRRDQRLVMKLLTVPDIDVAAVNGQGKTALHFAAGCVRPDVLAKLLDNGADALAQDKNARRPRDVLGDVDVCNPPYTYVQEGGLCGGGAKNNTKIFYGDMCPVPPGLGTELHEADLLLRVAMNKTRASREQPPQAPSTTKREAISSLATLTPQDGETSREITIPVIAAVIPAIFLLLFILAIAYMVYTRKSQRMSSDDDSHRERVRSRRTMRYRRHMNNGSLTGKSVTLPINFRSCSSRTLSTQAIFDDMLKSADWKKKNERMDEASSESSSSSEESTSCGWSESSDSIDMQHDVDGMHAHPEEGGMVPEQSDYSVVRMPSGSSSDGEVLSEGRRNPVGLRSVLVSDSAFLGGG